MRMGSDMAPGRRCRAAAAWVMLAMALFLGACEPAAAPDRGPLSEDELTALAAEVGPDWEVVQEYRKSHQEWNERVLDSLGSQEEEGETVDGADADLESERPDISRAAAAAIAILEHEAGHEKRGEAARFLAVDGARAPGGDDLAYRGAKALFDGDAEVQGWPMLLAQMDIARQLGEDGEPTGSAIDRFFEELASGAGDPRYRAAGRFYFASGLIASLNVGPLSSADRAARRERALQAATGLSAGVEDERVLLVARVRTFAEAEEDLVRTIRHATVGATVADVEGAGLDGAPEALSDYRGKVVLLDFWATWCKPCIAALPELRRLVADLPADRFVLLAISVDGQLETATRFMESEPMPFTHWYVGAQSDIARILDVYSFPTYMLIDEQGEILARTNGLDDDFLALIEETVG